MPTFSLGLNDRSGWMSSALARARTLFGDQLFTRVRGEMQPTPRAHELLQPTSISRLDFSAKHPSRNRDFLAGHCSRIALFVFCARRMGRRNGGSTCALFSRRQPVRIIAFPACAHALSARRRASTIDFVLQSRSLSRQVAVTVPHMLSSIALVGKSNLLAIVLERLARHEARRSGVRIYDSPIAIPTVAIVLAWHERKQFDPAYVWLREMIVRVCRRQSLGKATRHRRTKRQRPGGRKNA